MKLHEISTPPIDHERVKDNFVTLFNSMSEMDTERFIKRLSACLGHAREVYGTDRNLVVISDVTVPWVYCADEFFQIEFKVTLTSTVNEEGEEHIPVGECKEATFTCLFDIPALSVLGAIQNHTMPIQRFVDLLSENLTINEWATKAEEDPRDQEDYSSKYERW